MKISCDKCNALYEVDDSRIPAAGLTMKCPRCLASFTVRPPGPAAPPPPASGGGTRYYLRRRTGKVFGPFLERAIASMLEQQKLEGNEDISLDGQSWHALAEVPGLAPYVRGQGGKPAAPPPPPGRPPEPAELADLPAPRGFDAGLDLVDLPGPRGSSGSLDAGMDLADLPAPRGLGRGASNPGLDLSDLPAPKGLGRGVSSPGLDLSDLPAPKGLGRGVSSPGLDLADLPAPKGAPGRASGQASSSGFDLQGFDQMGESDPGEFDLGAEPADLPAPKARGGLAELADLPAPKRTGPPTFAPPPPPGRPPAPGAKPGGRATGLEYGQIDLGGDSDGGGELADLPAPKGGAAAEQAELPAPKRPATAGVGIVDLPKPKGGTDYGQIDLAGDLAELDEIPVAPGASAGLALDTSFDLPGLKATQPSREPPDLLAPRPDPASVDVVAPRVGFGFEPGPAEEEEEPGEVVTFAPPSREAVQAAGTPAMRAPARHEEELEEDLPQPSPRLRRVKPLWIGAGALAFLLVVGIGLGVFTDLGFFGLSVITGDYGKRQRAKTRISSAEELLRADTFQGYSQAADDLELAARALGDEPRPWALQAQAAAALLHRYGPNPTRRGQLEAALARLNKLEDQSPDADKARALLQLTGEQIPQAIAGLKKISDQEAGDAAAAVYLGWAHLAGGDARAALAAFARALARNSQLPAALFGTAQAHCRLDDQKSCEAGVEKTLAAAPGHAGALLMKARRLLATGQLAPVPALVQRVLGQPAAPVELSLARTLLAKHMILGGQVNQARLLLVEAVRINPNNALAHLEMGRLYYNARQYSEAQRLFRTARRLDPGDVQIAVMLAHTEIAIGQPLEARKVVVQIASVAPQTAEIPYLLGLIEGALGNLEAASTHFKNVITKNPSHFDAYYHLSKIRLRQNQPEEGLAVLQQAAGKLPDSAQVRAAQGELLYASKRLEPARQKLEEALILDRHHNQATFLLGSVLAGLGKMEAARDKLLDLKKRDQAYPGLAARLGEVYLELKQPGPAVTEFELALQDENPAPSVRLGAARAYLEAGDIDRSLEQSAKVLDGDVAFAGPARALRAEARFKQGRLDEALIEIQQGIERERKPAYFVLLGNVQEARNKPLDALDAYSDALKLDGSNLEVRLRRAVLLVKGGTVKDGLKELKMVVASNPLSAEAHYYMGEALAGLGQEAQAIQSWQTAVSRDPKHGHAHLKIAIVFIDTQRPAQAQPHLEAAIKSARPKDSWLPDAYYHLGDVARGRGQKKTAIEAFQNYLKIAPPTAALRADATKKLAQLGAPVSSGE